MRGQRLVTERRGGGGAQTGNVTPLGPDGVHPKLLKFLAYDDNFVEAVTQLFQRCPETGSLPLVWKSASVVALFKKGV